MSTRIEAYVITTPAIYLVTNAVTGKQYVGRSVNPRRRWHEHRRAARIGQRLCMLTRSIRKHGVEHFTFEILEECVSEADLRAAEVRWVAQLRTQKPHGYNQTAGGEDGATAMLSKTPEERSDIIRRANAALTAEQRSERSRKMNEALGPERRREIAFKKNASRTPEQRSDIARRVQAMFTPEQRSERQRLANAKLTAEQLSARSLRAWATRRAKAAEARL